MNRESRIAASKTLKICVRGSRNSACIYSYDRRIQSTTLGVLAIAMLFACHVSASNPVTRIFGLAMNDVASKVADLASPDSVTYALGLDFSPDGAQIAVDSFSEQIRSESISHSRVHVWDWQRSRIERSLVLPAGFGTETSTNPITYSPDGDLLTVCDGAGEGVALLVNLDKVSELERETFTA